MADDSSETKEYPPSQRKLRQLREQGNFPFSEELVATIHIALFFIVVYLMVDLLPDALSNYLNDLYQPDTNFKETLELSISFLLLIIALCFLLVVIAGVLQWGLVKGFAVDTTKVFKFDIQALHPKQGFSQIVGMKAFWRSFRKILILIVLSFFIIYVLAMMGARVIEKTLVHSFPEFWDVLLELILYTGAYLVFLACFISAVDYITERQIFMNQNKMTKTEMKEEFKEQEGNPEMKAKRRSIMNEMREEVAQKQGPNFALANPDHILLEMLYKKKVSRLPVILTSSIDAPAQDRKADLIRQGIPVVEYPELTRKIFSTTPKPGSFVPKDHFKDIALVIVALKRQNLIK